ncbi:uncharacterized protein EI97DRAFT_192094 [Westerdykella ornata]|uniref:Uncharacterized protein n=1 Tax=Westerdykella ornata TaxID=318751 RepID=A0A6A6J8W0_WESOR|nr:uncharacterized protein EI97DRAFT_192094 [Westerdykella ornata]KAF2273000.1 hypothetical protein EI97DRAFT_192094 [Westerdykella ornata]
MSSTRQKFGTLVTCMIWLRPPARWPVLILACYNYHEDLKGLGGPICSSSPQVVSLLYHVDLQVGHGTPRVGARYGALSERVRSNQRKLRAAFKYLDEISPQAARRSGVLLEPSSTSVISSVDTPLPPLPLRPFPFYFTPATLSSLFPPSHPQRFSPTSSAQQELASHHLRLPKELFSRQLLCYARHVVSPPRVLIAVSSCGKEQDEIKVSSRPRTAAAAAAAFCCS